MRVGHVRQSRPHWYDRGPINITRSYSAAGLAPHASTTRWSYTVPAGKKFQLQISHVMGRRETAATTAARVTVNVDHTPSGGSAMVMHATDFYTNGVGDGGSESLGSNAALTAGDLLAGLTSDASTTGTTHLRVTLQGLEFDA